MTWRQFQAWQRWLEADMERPSRSDHYAMQTALVVQSIFEGFSKHPRSFELSDFVIKFKDKPGLPAAVAAADAGPAAPAVAAPVPRPVASPRSLPKSVAPDHPCAQGWLEEERRLKEEGKLSKGSSAVWGGMLAASQVRRPNGRKEGDHGG